MQDGEGLVNFAFDPDALRLEAGQRPTLLKSAIFAVLSFLQDSIAKIFH